MDSQAKKQRRTAPAANSASKVAPTTSTATNAASTAAATTVLDIPVDCWEEILSHIDKLDNPHHPTHQTHENHRQSLSLTCKHLLSVTNHLPYSLPVSTQLFSHPDLLRRILRRFSSSLHSLDVNHYYVKVDDVFSLLAAEHAASFCLRSLRRIRIPFKSVEPINGLRRLAEVFIGLKVLEIDGLSDDHLIDICDFFCLIEEIDLGDGCHNALSDVGIVYLAKKLKSLKKIKVSWQHLITDHSLVALSDHCLSLSDVTIRRCPSVTQQGVVYMLRHCSKLVSLKVYACDADPPLSLSSFSIKDSVGFPRSLSTLKLSVFDVDDSLLISIVNAKLPLKKFVISSKKFEIPSFQNFTLQGLAVFLRAYPNLEKLGLQRIMFLNDQAVEGLVCYFKRLTVINLSSCELTEASFYLLVKCCPVLEEIRMEKTRLGEGKFGEVLVQSRSIKYLNLSHNLLTDENLQVIGLMCPNLVHLTVDGCSKLTSKGIGGVLQSCCELKHLSLDEFADSKLLDKDLECLRFKLEELCLISSGIKDDGLSGVAKACPGLMFLNLCLSPWVTSTGVKEVVRCCTRLKDIYLLGTDTSSDTVMWVVLARPSLRAVVPPLCYRRNNSDEEVFFNHGCSVDPEDDIDDENT